MFNAKPQAIIIHGANLRVVQTLTDEYVVQFDPPIIDPHTGAMGEGTTKNWKECLRTADETEAMEFYRGMQIKCIVESVEPFKGIKEV